ncbi:MAG: DUF2278 family protein [Deltaproteobacteria bacterium]|nr:DUF2278 family protein [Deltaproteobacteria bacterium]
MALTYGFLKCKVVSDPILKSSRHKREIQYHLHVTVGLPDGSNWDVAINVGTNDSDDLLRYKLVFDYQHPIVETLKATSAGFSDLTTTGALPALDFLRSNVLDGTGPWRISDVMDGSEGVEPVASLARLLQRAQANNADVYLFGRTYTDGALGIHDVHLNQGSSSETFFNNGIDDHNDHNSIWQDGAAIVDFKEPECAAYFTAFTQQEVPTDDLGNPGDDSHPINDADAGTLSAN